MLLVLTLVVVSVVESRNALLRTPPMGWMSWELFRCNLGSATDDCSDPSTTHCISEALYKGQADALVARGFLSAGYNAIHLDDCFQASARDPATGQLLANSTRFPSGLPALGRYFHGKNISFALYTAEAPHSCAGYPGSAFHEVLDAATFASMGVDYLKVDGCGSTSYYAQGYKAMGAALEASGRPIAYSCSWPGYINQGNQGSNESLAPFATLIMDGCNLWRNYHDIQCSYGSMLSIVNHWGFWGSVMAPWAGPGHWHDPDMLIIGAGCLTPDEERTQMAIWSVIAAPLIMGNDLRNASEEAVAVLTNPRAIAVSQDPLGQMGLRVEGGDATPSQVWARRLADGSVAVAAFNNLGGVAPQPTCAAWNHTPGGFFNSCGGGLGWFYNASVSAAQARCCENAYCAGILYDEQTASGTFVVDYNCTFVPSTTFSEYTRVGFQPPEGTPLDIDIDLRAAGLDTVRQYEITDIWSGQPLGTIQGQSKFTAGAVPFHGTAFLRFSPA